jgi:hypothetical protein
MMLELLTEHFNFTIIAQFFESKKCFGLLLAKEIEFK